MASCWSALLELVIPVLTGTSSDVLSDNINIRDGCTRYLHGLSALYSTAQTCCPTRGRRGAHTHAGDDQLHVLAAGLLALIARHRSACWPVPPAGDWVAEERVPAISALR
ncbi:hypothetical protein C8R44DRAFT_729918 [Mycena epipterygia]|nr:hypothetical protein C8R44DRAFT_729918 [Mycena epipterygia]